MSNLKNDYLINKIDDSDHVIRHLPDLKRLGRSFKVLDNNYDKSSLKSFRVCDRKSFPQIYKPIDINLSKSIQNLSSHCANADFLNVDYSKDPTHHLSHNLTINNLLAKLYQMEQQIELTSAELVKFEKKFDEVNQEKDELTQALLANQAKEYNNSTENAIITLKEENILLKKQLDSQIFSNSKIEKENANLVEELKINQIKLIESNEMHKQLIQIKNRELDENKLKIERLSMESNLREDENSQLELENKRLCNKIFMLNQVTDRQDEKLEEHNNQIKRYVEQIKNFECQLNAKETENEKLKKELILTKNTAKKMQNLNQTNENLIFWLNKQLTDSQGQYNVLYPKPFNKSTSINLHQRRIDCESNLSEAFSDSHLKNQGLMNNYQSNLKTDLTDLKDTTVSNFDRNGYASNFRGERKTDYSSKLKNEFKNEHKIRKQFDGSFYSSVPNSAERRINSFSQLNDFKSSKYNNNNLLYASKRLADNSFKCTIGK